MNQLVRRIDHEAMGSVGLLPRNLMENETTFMVTFIKNSARWGGHGDEEGAPL